jgi:UDP-glucose 4-epimerase
MDLGQVYRGRTVLVTGAGGFIGSHLVETLLDLGARVRALEPVPLTEAVNLASVGERITYYQRSISDHIPLDDTMEGCDFVFHLAANASVALSTTNPSLDFEINVAGSHRVIEAFRRRGRGTLLFTSTASVYGEPQQAQIDERHPLRPQSPYAGSKLAVEYLLDAHARCYGFDHRRVRLFSTYGPRQRGYVMFDLLEKLRRDPRQLEVLGTGEQRRTYSYVSDTVKALLWVAAHPAAQGEVFNIGGSEPVSIKNLAELIVSTIGIPRPTITFTGRSWKGDIRQLHGDWSRLRGLGFNPDVGLQEGIRRLVDWHRREYSPPW